MITVIGSYVSPFVRKVLACLELMELDYRIDQPAFRKLQVFEEQQGRAPIARHRAVLAAMGLQFTPQTVGGTEPRPGAMRS